MPMASTIFAGPMEEGIVRKHTKAVVHGLRYLHRKGIMHRDIKGQNVLVDSDGTAKLTDFGASEKIHTVVEYATKDGAHADCNALLNHDSS